MHTELVKMFDKLVTFITSTEYFVISSTRVTTKVHHFWICCETWQFFINAASDILPKLTTYSKHVVSKTIFSMQLEKQFKK